MKQSILSPIRSFFEKFVPYYRSLLVVGVPIMIGQLGIIVVNFADNIMVGQHHTDELAAASFVNNIFNLISIFGLGFSFGLTPLIGKLTAQNRVHEAGKQLRYSLIANFLLSLLLMGVLALIYFNLHRLGQPEVLLPLIRPYFIIQLIGLLPLMLFNSFKQFFDGIMETRTPMYILLAGNLLNIVGNYLLIYGKCGLPEWGLVGAGISTLTARIFIFVACGWLFFARKGFSRLREGFWQKGIHWYDFKQLIALSIPLAMQMGMEAASFNLSIVMMGWIGSTALAAHQVVATLTTIGFMLYYGVGSAVTILASNKKGKGDYEGVSLVAASGYHLVAALAAVVSVIMLLLRNHIGVLFTDSAEVTTLAAALVIPMVAYQFSDGLQIVYANALRAMEDVKPMAIIAFISYFVVSLPASYLFAFVCDWGATGVWWGYPIALTLAGVLFWLRFRHVVGKHL